MLLSVTQFGLCLGDPFFMNRIVMSSRYFCGIEYIFQNFARLVIFALSLKQIRIAIACFRTWIVAVQNRIFF